MLFNSVEFIFFFLPVVLAGFYFLRRFFSNGSVYIWLALVSLFYYGYWKPAYLLLILFSIGFNYLVGRKLGHLSTVVQLKRPTRTTLIFGVSVNLLLLGYFKYTYFIVDSISAVSGMSFGLPRIILPLGISFFTFQQIAYLVDAYEGKTHEYNIFHYSLFVTFFPQLIAGPIVHHKEMLTQFEQKAQDRFSSRDFAEGITFFGIGLFKKVILADTLAAFASPYFSVLAQGDALGFLASWMVILAYTFQIYFDFSGYSDMALGLGKMFSINLPENFNSPYKATSIVDFWRRWHITLSRFLRDYLYIPLGGNRRGVSLRYVNLMATMLIGGLWHGAGWLFVIWGGLHGAYLCINHGWHALMRKAGNPVFVHSFWWSTFCRILTFMAVVFAWVFFRSETFAGSTLLIKGMMGGCGLGTVPERLEDLPQLIVLSFAIVWLLPNTADFIFGRVQPWERFPAVSRRLAWNPGYLWAVVLVCITVYTLGHINRISEFIYYQF